MAGLTQDQRRVICDYLWTRIADAHDENIVGIGFGAALKDQEIDLSRPSVIRFYVRKKRSPTGRSRPKFPIGKVIKVPLAGPQGLPESNRGLRLPWASFPTDVHEIGDLVSTARQISVKGIPSRVSGGIIVRWFEATDPQPHWGIVTVGHGFNLPIDPQSLGGDATIVNPQSGDEFRGRRLLQFRPPQSGMDLCLIGVVESNLVAHHLIETPSQPPRPVRRYEQLGGDLGAGGLSRQIRRDLFFSVVGPVDSLAFKGIGTVRNLLHVLGPPQAFVVGTSGSPFEVLNGSTGSLEAAAIQVGADSDTSFRDGYGESLETALDVLAKELSGQLISRGSSLTNGRIDFIATF